MPLDSSLEPSVPQPLTAAEIQDAVFDALRAANLARDPASQLTIAPDADLFGGASPLDSLGLLALLLDVEDSLRAVGWPLVLSDDRAMSLARSPFRTVATLVGYIETLARG